MMKDIYVYWYYYVQKNTGYLWDWENECWGLAPKLETCFDNYTDAKRILPPDGLIKKKRVQIASIN